MAYDFFSQIYSFSLISFTIVVVPFDRSEHCKPPKENSSFRQNGPQMSRPPKQIEATFPGKLFLEWSSRL